MLLLACLTSVKVDAGVGLGGPETEPVGPAEQTGVAACKGELGCGQPDGKEGVERGDAEWG